MSTIIEMGRTNCKCRSLSVGHVHVDIALPTFVLHINGKYKGCGSGGDNKRVYSTLPIIWGSITHPNFTSTWLTIHVHSGVKMSIQIWKCKAHMLYWNIFPQFNVNVLTTDDLWTAPVCLWAPSITPVTFIADYYSLDNHIGWRLRNQSTACPYMYIHEVFNDWVSGSQPT
jgi:hypothetical protein